MEMDLHVSRTTCATRVRVRIGTSVTSSGGRRSRPARAWRFTGVSRLKRNGWLFAGLGGLLLRRGVTAHCDFYEAVGINTAGTAATRARRCADRAASTCSRASRSTARSRTLYRSGATSRTCRSSCATSSRWRSVTDTHLALARQGPGRHARRVGRRDHQRSAEQADRLALARRLRRRQRRLGQLRRRGRGRGTRVRVRLQYSPPGGKVGAAVARLFGRDAEHRDPRGPAPLQAARRSRRSSHHDGQPRGYAVRGLRLQFAVANPMKALCWYGTNDVRIARVPDPRILNPRDAIIKVTLDRDLRLRSPPARRLHSRR